MENVQTFGETLRKLRLGSNLPLKRLAETLNIDQSTLSKIERNERKANENLIDQLSKIFKTNKKNLYISYVSDNVVSELLDRENSSDILRVAEKKISHIKHLKRISYGK